MGQGRAGMTSEPRREQWFLALPGTPEASGLHQAPSPTFASSLPFNPAKSFYLCFICSGDGGFRSFAFQMFIRVLI